MKSQSKVIKFSKKKLKEEIIREARVLNIHVGAAEMMADKVVEKVAKWAEGRAAITQEDLNVVTAREIGKYHADLAYVYKNRGKII